MRMDIRAVDDEQQRQELCDVLRHELIDKHSCVYDTENNMFAMLNWPTVRLSTFMQRKLCNLCSLIVQNNNNNNENISSLAAAKNCTLGTSLVEDQVILVSALMQSMVGLTINSNTSDVANYVQRQKELKNNLLQCMYAIVERIVIDSMLACDHFRDKNSNNQQQQQQQLQQHQQQQQVTTRNATMSRLWSEIRARGCQFLGPQMQDDIIQMIAHALDVAKRMSRRVLVLYVVYVLKKQYPKASKTNVGHVVQLLYRAGCFKLEKRENDSSLMELRPECATYEALRLHHDMQIVQIALDAGIQMSADLWSQKLYGDASHKAYMQTIIDKLQMRQTLSGQLVKLLYDKSNTTGNLSTCFAGTVKADLEYLAAMRDGEKRAFVDERRKSFGTEEMKAYADNDDANNDDYDEFNMDEDDDLSFPAWSDQQSTSDEDASETRNGRHGAIMSPSSLVDEPSWPQLSDYLRRCVRILSAYFSYSSHIAWLMVANKRTSTTSASLNESSSSSSNNSSRNQADLGATNAVSARASIVTSSPTLSRHVSMYGDTNNAMKGQSSQQYSTTTNFVAAANNHRLSDAFVGEIANSSTFDLKDQLFNTLIRPERMHSASSFVNRIYEDRYDAESQQSALAFISNPFQQSMAINPFASYRIHDNNERATDYSAFYQAP